MKRTAIWTLLITGALALGTALLSSDVRAQSNGGLKLAFIEVERIREGSKTFIAEQAKIDEARENAQKEIDQVAETLKQEMENLDAKKDMLDSAAYSEQRGELRKKMIDYDNMKRKKASELLDMREAALAPQYKRLEETVEAMAKEEGYDFVFLRRRIAYGAAKYDITQKIIDRLNKEYKEQ
ncbi:MAG: OmpH family outer membrane protein [bacterium]